MKTIGRFRLFIIWGLLFISLMGCREPSNLAGSFWVEASTENKSLLNKIEFAPQGRGTWSRGEERVEFRWEMKEQDLWLHSKSGGVVAGRIGAADHLEITLPGTGVVVFKKTTKEGSE